MSETFKEIPGYEGLYEASTFGRIKSLPKQNGNHYRPGSKILTPTINNSYKYVSISIDDYAIKKSVHRFVAKTFILNPENKPQINHIDGNKLNNHVNNLEWVTPKENMAHAKKNGLSNHMGNAKLNPRKVIFIRRSTKTNKELGLLFGLLPDSIGNIRAMRSWKTV